MAPPLWQQLQATAQALQGVRQGQSLTALLEAVDAALRPGVQALTFQVLRRLGQAQALRQLLARRAPPPAADALLCSALALGCESADTPYEIHTLVDQAVEAAKRHPATRGQAAFLNACLRRFLREREALTQAIAHDPVAQWNHPLWWIERLQKDHPGHWQAILRQANTRAPMALRINLQRTDKAHYQQALAAAGMQASWVSSHGLVMARACPVQQLPGFAQGQVSVQDGAAQLAAPLLLQGLVPRSASQKGAAPVPLRVLDACAAPGGKTAHLLELLQPQDRVVAIDIDASRCERIHQNLQRLGLQAQVLVADAAQSAQWWPQHCQSQLFDAILLDAPCTASGIVRRHPDVRWLRRATDVAQLGQRQSALLAALWPLLKPGGQLLYCTCSVFKAEGSEQIQTFVARNTDAVLAPSPGHLLPPIGANGTPVPDNPLSDHDSFFYALLQKRLLA
ncbi:MAG: 16S rRNA (cytosine(967)-C(5))-methyltransferase RsmB [Burkholderiales bacterium]